MRGTCLALAILLTAPAASAATYVAIAEMPGGHLTTVQGINGKNQLVGYYYNTGASIHGFTGPVGGPYDVFDVGTARTYAQAINNMGTIVGSSDDVDDPTRTGFERYADGRTVTIKKGGKPIPDAEMYGVSNPGTFVGVGYLDGENHTSPFEGQKGKFTAMVDTALHYTEPHAVNASNVVVGFFYIPSLEHGFILEDGVLTQIDYPDDGNVNGTRLNGINDDGIVTGRWLDLHHRPHAFKYDMNTATFTPLHPPGTPYSTAWGINEKGLIAMTSDIGSFVYCPNAKRCPASGTVVAGEPSIHARPRR